MRNNNCWHVTTVAVPVSYSSMFRHSWAIYGRYHKRQFIR